MPGCPSTLSSSPGRHHGHHGDGKHEHARPHRARRRFRADRLRDYFRERSLFRSHARGPYWPHDWHTYNSVPPYSATHDYWAYRPPPPLPPSYPPPPLPPSCVRVPTDEGILRSASEHPASYGYCTYDAASDKTHNHCASAFSSAVVHGGRCMCSQPPPPLTTTDLGYRDAGCGAHRHAWCCPPATE